MLLLTVGGIIFACMLPLVRRCLGVSMQICILMFVLPPPPPIITDMEP